MDVFEKLIDRLDAGEPLPNALLGDATDGLRAFTGESQATSEQEFLAVEDVSQRAAAHVLVGEMELALEALERGEAGAAGAFVVRARDCVRLLRNHAGLELGLQWSPKTGTDSELLPDRTWTLEHSSMLRHFQRLLERYVKWTGASQNSEVKTPGDPIAASRGAAKIDA